MESVQHRIPNTQYPISGNTRLVGVMGWPISHSLSPRMHNAAFDALGLDWAYVPLSVPPERVGDAVRGLSALGFAGTNVTVPHKSAVIPFLDALTPIARAIGAANTIVVLPDGSLLGDNTDGAGFMADLRAHGVRVCGSVGVSGSSLSIPPYSHTPTHALILGAGGAARAVAYVLADAGAIVAVANRTPDRAWELCQTVAAALPEAADRLSAHAFPDGLAELAPEADLVVNATSLGLRDGDPLPWDAAIAFRTGQVVYDLIYNRPTPLLALAEAQGARTIDGLGMLVHQGACAFELWTGREAPIDVMMEAFRDT
jgi:shikimate dehydrogenase